MLFELNDFWLYFLAIINFIFLIWSLEKQKYLIAISIFLFYFLIFVLQKITLIQKLDYIYFVYYFSFGLIYVFLSWIVFVIHIKFKNIQEKKKWLNGYENLTNIIENKLYDTKKAALKNSILDDEVKQQELFLNALKECNGLMTNDLLLFWYNYEKNKNLERPEPFNYKLKICSWFVLWPFHLLVLVVKYLMWNILKSFPIVLGMFSKLIWR